MPTRSHPATSVRRLRSVVAVALAIVAASCTSGSSPSPSPAGPTAPAGASPSAAAAGAGSSSASPATGSITLYTSVTQNTVDAVVKSWTDAHPGRTVNVFRAATAQVAARIATDLQSGGIRADVLWLSDPLSIEGYAAQGLLQAWVPAGSAAIDPRYRTSTFFGTRLLNMVMVRGTGVAAGTGDWRDMTATDVRGAVALPDPAFAGSAFAALGYFSQADGYGTAFYQQLKDNGATQVQAPDDVTSGVAEGRFKVGMTLDSSVRTAIAKGSPVTMVWPTSGAIAIYSPIAVVAASADQAAAESFVEATISPAGQALIAGTGWQPVVGTGGPQPGGTEVSPDWVAAFGKQQDLLAAYHAIFGG